MIWLKGLNKHNVVDKYLGPNSLLAQCYFASHLSPMTSKLYMTVYLEQKPLHFSWVHHEKTISKKLGIDLYLSQSHLQVSKKCSHTRTAKCGKMHLLLKTGSLDKCNWGCFNWLSHHSIRAIVVCVAKMLSICITFCLSTISYSHRSLSMWNFKWHHCRVNELACITDWNFAENNCLQSSTCTQNLVWKSQCTTRIWVVVCDWSLHKALMLWWIALIG